MINKTSSKTALIHNSVANISLSRKATPEPIKGKPKQAAWDAKGRLLDMEAAFKDVMKEKDLV